MTITAPTFAHVAARSGVNVAGERHVLMAPDGGAEAVAPAPAAQPGTESRSSDPKPRTAAEKLSDRIAHRRAQAEKMRLEVLNGGASKKKADADEPDKPAAEAKPELETRKDPKDAAAQKASAELAAAQQKIEALEKETAEGEHLAERALARITRLETENKSLRAMLKQHGVSTDPRDAELMRYREAERVRQLGAERATAAATAQQQAQAAAQAQQAQAALEASCRDVLAKHPELDPRKGQEQVEFWRAVYRGADPVALAAIVVPGLRAKANAAPAPRTLPRGTGAGGEKISYDPRDVADRFKARLRAM